MRAPVLYTQSSSSLSHRSHRLSVPCRRAQRFLSLWQRSHAARNRDSDVDDMEQKLADGLMRFRGGKV